MRFTSIQKWYIKSMLIVIIVSFFATMAYAQQETVVCCNEIITRNYCAQCGTPKSKVKTQMEETAVKEKAEKLKAKEMIAQMKEGLEKFDISKEVKNEVLGIGKEFLAKDSGKKLPVHSLRSVAEEKKEVASEKPKISEERPQHVNCRRDPYVEESIADIYDELAFLHDRISPAGEQTKEEAKEMVAPVMVVKSFHRDDKLTQLRKKVLIAQRSLEERRVSYETDKAQERMARIKERDTYAQTEGIMNEFKRFDEALELTAEHDPDGIQKSEMPNSKYRFIVGFEYSGRNPGPAWRDFSETIAKLEKFERLQSK